MMISMSHRSLLPRLSSDDIAAAMVEFAIVAAAFTIMILGTAEFALAAWQKNSVAADAREGARYAAVHGARSGTPVSDTQVRDYVRSRTSLDPLGVRVYTSWSPDKQVGSTVTVSVAHTVPRRGPFIPQHTDSATAKMIILY
jgi:Flp pilus assembly protein TadG